MTNDQILKAWVSLLRDSEKTQETILEAIEAIRPPQVELSMPRAREKALREAEAAMYEFQAAGRKMRERFDVAKSFNATKALREKYKELYEAMEASTPANQF